MAGGVATFNYDFATPRDWARMYREHGIQVVPGHTPKAGTNWKRPGLAEWKEFQEGLVPEAIFEGWFPLEARPNMGILTGRASGNIFVIDLDLYKTPAALDWWRGVLEVHNHGFEPETWQQTTGGGGKQLFFRAPVGWVAPTNRTPIGVDVRGQGGFAILPPSLHESGQEYAWIPGLAPWETEIEDAPAWLLEAVDELVAQHGGGKSTPRVNGGADLDPFGIRQDGREEYMTRLIWAAVCKLREECPIKPLDTAKVRDETYATYERKVKARVPGVKPEGLEAEGRGFSVFKQKWERAMGKWDDAVKPTITANSQFVAMPHIWRRNMSRREWLYGNILARGFLSVDIAPGGGAKTSQNIVETLAMVSGKPLMGIAPPQRLRVWYWNLEDPADEIDRRILAACLYYGLVEDDLKDHLFVNHGRDTPLCLAKTVQGQTSIDAAIGENLVDQIKANGIDVVIADPFVSSHQVPENDNNAIDLVAKAWGKIAGRGDCGCRLLHHTRKGEQEVNAESGRGASALIGAARIVRVFNRMTKEEGEKAGIEGENYRRYYRTYIDKQNMAPPADRSDWSYLESVGLPNGGLGTAGDSVGASIPWKWPDPLSGMSGHDFDAAAGEIRTGQWRADPQSSQWVGVPIGRALKINISDPMGRGQVKAIIAAWLKAGSLLVVEKPGPNRHVKKWIEVARND